MSTLLAPSAFLNMPITTTLQPPNFRIAKLNNFSREFLFPGFLHRQFETWGSNTMDKPIKIPPLRADGEIDVVVRGALDLEQEEEGLIHGSSRLSSNRFESTLNSMSKWLGTAVFVALVLIRHDGKVLWAASGSISNAVICNLLKKIINQERPVGSLKSDPGMPSSHAQSFFFIFSFAIISMIEYFGVNGLTLALSGLSLIIASYLSWLRVPQKFHTLSQVVVGSALGSIFCILWFWIWDTFVRELFVSYLWVRIFVLLGAAAFVVGFVVHVIQHWIINTE